MRRVRGPAAISGYFVHFLDESSHFMWAFSQDALSFGVLAASTGVTAPAMRPAATSMETRVFIGVSSQELGRDNRRSRSQLGAGTCGAWPEFCVRGPSPRATRRSACFWTEV